MKQNHVQILCLHLEKWVKVLTWTSPTASLTVSDSHTYTVTCCSVSWHRPQWLGLLFLLDRTPYSGVTQACLFSMIFNSVKKLLHHHWKIRGIRLYCIVCLWVCVSFWYGYTCGGIFWWKIPLLWGHIVPVGLWTGSF